jgi:hypothetical protein
MNKALRKLEEELKKFKQDSLLDFTLIKEKMEEQ